MVERVKFERNSSPVDIHFSRRTASISQGFSQRFGSRQYQCSTLKKLAQSKIGNLRAQTHLHIGSMKRDDDRNWAPSDKWQPKDPVVPEINMYQVRLLLDQRVQQASTLAGKC